MIFNDRLDAGVAAFFLISVVIILTTSISEWLSVIKRRQKPVSSEAPYVHTKLLDEAA